MLSLGKTGLLIMLAKARGVGHGVTRGKGKAAEGRFSDPYSQEGLNGRRGLSTRALHDLRAGTQGPWNRRPAEPD